MDRFARWVVRHRKLILILSVLLLIPSVFGAAGTYINYDILTYLPKELDSMVGEGYLENDFNMASTGMITVENMTTADTLKLKADLEQVEGVKSVMWTSDILDVTTPKEMLPADLQKFFYNDSGATMMLVQFENPSADKKTMEAQHAIKAILQKNCFIGGMSAILEDTKNLVNQEMPLYILCAAGASLLILFLSMKETMVPLLFMLGMIFPIAYNFGTNYFLGQISYITEALATVLQLGVTMDFSIFLLHRFEEEKERGFEDEEAMVQAIRHPRQLAYHHCRISRHVYHDPDPGRRHRSGDGQGRIPGCGLHHNRAARPADDLPEVNCPPYTPHLHTEAE